MLYGFATLLWIARSIRKEQTIEVKLIEVVVPWNPDNLNASVYQATNDVSLDTAVNKYYTFACSLVIANDLLAAHLLHPIDAAVICVFKIFRVHRNNNPPSHYATLSESLCEPSRVDPRDGRDFFSLQPFCERLLGIPMAVLLAVICHDEAFNMNPLAFHELWQRFSSCIRNAIVSYQGISRHQYLPCIAWVGQAFRIACHRSIEHHFAHGICLVAERLAAELCAVIKYESRFLHCFLYFSPFQ